MKAMEGHPPMELTPTPFETKPETHTSCQTLSQIVNFVNNPIYKVTQTLSIEIYLQDIYSWPLIREHHDSYLLYINA